jgi:hypothetical protein
LFGRPVGHTHGARCKMERRPRRDCGMGYGTVAEEGADSRGLSRRERGGC